MEGINVSGPGPGRGGQIKAREAQTGEEASDVKIVSIMGEPTIAVGLSHQAAVLPKLLKIGRELTGRLARSERP